MRGTIRILLPIALISAVLLVACGAIQNFAGIHEVGQFMGGSQQWNGGAVASQEAIKELGTNGGGYFNANSAHPFENPNGLSNLLEIFLILVIPLSLTRTFGRMTGSVKQGYAILGAMVTIWIVFTALMMWTEFHHGGRRSSWPGVRRRARRPGSGSAPLPSSVWRRHLPLRGR